MTRKTYGTLTAKPVDIDASDIFQERRALARLQTETRYIPDAYFWNRAIRTAGSLTELRKLASTLAQEVALLQREFRENGMIPPKGCWAPGETDQRIALTQVAWASDNFYTNPHLHA